MERIEIAVVLLVSFCAVCALCMGGRYEPLTLIVTGQIDPDATGYYQCHSKYGSANRFRRIEGSYWIWKSGSEWTLATVSGPPVGDYYWWKSSGHVGDYAPGGNSSGTAKVEELFRRHSRYYYTK